MNLQEQKSIKILKRIAKELGDKLHCDRHGSCVHFAELFVDEVNEKYPSLLNDFDVIEGYVNSKVGDGIPQEHTWIRLKNNEVIDPTFLQFTKYDTNSKYSLRKSNVYTGQEYYDEGKEGSWFSERRKEQPNTVFKEGKKELIKRILREESKLPSFIRRRYSEEDIDELISNVKFSIPKYDDDTNIDDVIYDEVREFMMGKSDFGYFGTLRNVLIGNEYFVQLSKFEEPLRDYIKSVILNTNLQESKNTSLQDKLLHILKSKGVELALKAVGGFKNFSQILNIDSPIDYLHLFDDLKIIPLSETEFSNGFFNENNTDCYGYSPDKIIFIHFKDREGEGRISYEEIWEILQEEFGLTYDETRELTMEWLNSVFDLQVSNTFDDGY